MKAKCLVFASGLIAAALIATPASAQVANGGFEATSSSPPAAGEWQYNGGAVRDTTLPHSGRFAANLNNVTEASNTNVLQTSLPGSVTPGQTYTLSFWAQGNYGVSGVGQAQFSFLNSGGGILPGSPQFINIPASAAYVNYTQNFTAPAGASEIFIGFNAVTGAVAGATSHLYVDDVAFSVVPEPTTLASIGLLALGLKRSRGERSRRA